jgi:hypothetical protein
VIQKNYVISVGLYLRGDELDPKFISKKLGVIPSESQYKGEEKITSTNHKYITKIGVWALISESESDSCIVADHIDQLTSKIISKKVSITELAGVQEAYVDVFIAADADDKGECTCEFQLIKENIEALERLGLPVRFTVTAGRP